MHFPAIYIKICKNEKQLYMSLKYVYYPHNNPPPTKVCHVPMTLILVYKSQAVERK